MRVEELNYHLPAELIAQRPLPARDSSRLLVLNRESGDWKDRRFADLPELLRGDELLVFNNARVLPARLFGHRAGVHAQRPARKTAREHLAGTVEVFLTRQLGGDQWQALVRPGRKIPVGERITFGVGELTCEILARGELGLRTVSFASNDDRSVASHIERLGHVPLPPYIDRPDEDSDRERYQTIYAHEPRAVAAPTAGLHFTPDILRRIRERGCDTYEITLSVGLGTFQPVHTDSFEQHHIHTEAYEISLATAEKIDRAKKQSRPVLAVGTTVVRTLEDAALRRTTSDSMTIVPRTAEAELFILPGHQFRVVDALLTNFHLPKSTLLALVASFAGKQNILAAYRHAVEEGYRFYSYGDCMLIR